MTTSAISSAPSLLLTALFLRDVVAILATVLPAAWLYFVLRIWSESIEAASFTE